ncbi:MAG: VWA domain-containing protein, partial [Deltaproteobacteria bacterium]|nr:VWA domain-containing protein [Deltaproteobacteria bacterium]
MKTWPVGGLIAAAFVVSSLAAIGPESPLLDTAHAQPRPAPGATGAAAGQRIGEGMMYGRNERGEERPFSLERTDVEGRIGGRLVEVTVTQSFLNPYPTPLDARYVFPLPEDAAVHEMVMVVGDRIVRGEIHERRRAEEIYERARSEGRRAALLTEQRDNVFTQSVANIGPRERILVRIGYTHLARRVRASGSTPGGYEVVFPMVVGPRYTPGDTLACAGDGCATQPPQSQNPPRRTESVSPPVARHARLVANAVRMRWLIDGGGTALSSVASPTHALEVARPDPTHASATLEAREVPADRDFVLRWSLQADTPRMSLLAHPPRADEDGYVGLLLEPQAVVAPAQATPRELLFVVDTSGSMSGEPLARVRAAMHRALDGMRPTDTFQIMRFSSGVSRHAPQPVVATREEIARGHAYVDRMGGWGGTEMLSGVRAALGLPPSPGRLRIVLFMTDGYIGNDAEVVRAIHDQIGPARLFSFGVGSSVNRDLLQRMADVGRGQAEIVTLEEPVEPAVERFYARIDRPNLTDVTITAEGLELRDQYPQTIPDVFADQPVSIVARYPRGGQGAIVLRGRVAGRPFEQRVALTLPERAATQASPPSGAPAAPARADDENRALRYVWARARIRDLQWEQIEVERPEVVERITRVALQYHLVTPYTAFVAVEREMAPVDRARVQRESARVALPAGLDYDAIFGRAGRGQTTASLSPARLQPGDPEILVHAPEDALRVTATLPWGDEVECAWQPDENAWMGRFLVPRGTPDGTYRVNVRVVGRRGDEQRVFLFYRVDATAPVVRAQAWREGAFVVVRAIAVEHVY